MRVFCLKSKSVAKWMSRSKIKTSSILTLVVHAAAQSLGRGKANQITHQVTNIIKQNERKVTFK